ncbi:hypothetical protein LH51_08565 [Nitrincola sp. A-D6]|uniref:hypothetical protein n=1 Tax=Nitrincola sp. A-D6 TaxID=1545442 RepID=UPI00051FD881|nr:hypothetical protein [Nitrincola sp. A-D6]KGK42281.1 hypothetical protein LH51_08565 [Nitrincola sp. A-D6]
MSKLSTPLVLTGLGSLAVGVLIGWQVNSSAPVVEESVPDTPVIPTLQLGESQRGELTSQSALNRKDGSRFSEFQLPLNTDKLVEVELKGSLEGMLSLFNSNAELLASAPLLRYRVEQPGDYTLVVSGQDADSYGPFTLDLREVELSDTDLLTVPADIRNWLQQDETGHYVLTIEESGFYQIDMQSDEIDSFLVLQGSNGYRTEDDDGGNNLDARIREHLEAGEYQLTVSSYSEEAGFYTLTVVSRDAADMEYQNQAGTLELDQTVSARLASDKEDVYQVTLAEAGNYQIDMVSDDIDTYLELEGNGFYLSDDDGGGDLNARIQSYMEAGEYRVIAKSYDETAQGAYQLTLTPVN